MTLRTIRRARLVAIFLLLFIVTAVGYVTLDRWQRQTIFSVELGEHRWWRDPPAGTEVFDLVLPQGDKVRAWYIQHPDPDAPTVLYLHGSRWNLNGSVFRMERWVQMGHSLLAIDYRGFGDSTQRLPSQASVLADARAALQELARRQPDPARRFIYGHSLGGAVATQLAAQSDMPPVAGLILESTFTSIRDMIVTTQWSGVPGLGLLVTQPFDSADALARVRLPVLLLHGTGDRVVPHTMSDTLLAAAQAPEGLRRLVKLEGASHSGASRSSPVYDDAIRAFVQDATKAAQHAQPSPSGSSPTRGPAVASRSLFQGDGSMPMTENYALTEPSRADIEAILGPTLLEFGTPWCSHCRASQRAIAQAFSSYPDVRHLKIEDGKGLALGRSFKVKLWPTMVFLRDGKEVGRLVRSTDANEIVREMERISRPSDA